MTGRRTFLKQASLISSAAITFPVAAKALEGFEPTHVLDPRRILFQGDSITDGNRSRNTDWNHVMGHGYAYLISSRLWYDFPDKKFEFFNRGISGNRVPDLLERWETDTLALKPDLLSILIGINDTTLSVNGNTSSTSEGYEHDYRTLLQQTKTALPEVQLVLCEPFILPVGKVKDKWDAYVKELTPRQQMVKKLAVEFNAIFVGLQQPFNDALKRAPPEYWIWDGVHPMPGGHELMAREWIKQVHKQIKFI